MGKNDQRIFSIKSRYLNTDSLSGINAFGDGKVHASEKLQMTINELGNKQEIERFP